MTCSGCDKPKPNDWCWEGRMLDCPSGKPPVHLSTFALWHQLTIMHERITALETKEKQA